MSLFHNLQLKILAFFCAIILWFFVVGVENNTFRFPEELEVHAINTAQGLSVSNDLAKAKISIRGNPDIVKNLSKSDFEIFVDLKNRSAGEYQVPLLATSKNDRITVLRVEPSTLRARLEEISEKEVKIKVIFIGKPKKGYVVKEVKMKNQTAKIKAGESIVDKITTVTAEIKLDGSESANFTTNAPLTLAENKNFSTKNVTITPQMIEAEIILAAELQQKTVIVKPVLKGAVEPGSLTKKLLIEPVTVVVQGYEEILKNLNYLETEGVSLEMLKGSEKPLSAKLIVPQDVALLDPESGKVQITLIQP